MSGDLNDYDSSVVSCEHERMSPTEWEQAYAAAVRTFYSARNMARILSRHDAFSQRWRLTKGFLWCRWSYLTERTHPMCAGLYRFRPLSEMRPGGRMGRLRYWWDEAMRHARYTLHAAREVVIFKRVLIESELRVFFGRLRPCGKENTTRPDEAGEPRSPEKAM